MTGTNEFTTERLIMRRYPMDDALILYEKFGVIFNCIDIPDGIRMPRMIWHTVRFKDL